MEIIRGTSHRTPINFREIKIVNDDICMRTLISGKAINDAIVTQINIRQ